MLQSCPFLIALGPCYASTARCPHAFMYLKFIFFTMQHSIREESNPAFNKIRCSFLLSTEYTRHTVRTSFPGPHYPLRPPYLHWSIV